jgi:hypothetical protein
MLVSDDRPGYSVHKLTKLYARRMTLEELFRDARNRRYGWGLRDTLITRGDLYHHSCQLVGWLATDSCIGIPERKSGRVHPGWFDRLLLILALAYWILLSVALVAKQRHLPGTWSSSNQQGACSLFFIGRQMIERLQDLEVLSDLLSRKEFFMGRQRIERMQVRAAEALDALLGALFSESQKLGIGQVENILA